MSLSLTGSPALTSALVVGVATVVLLTRRARGKKLDDLLHELARAEEKVQAIRAQIELSSPSRSPARHEVRIWMDGAFDMMHYGHANAFRQGRWVGTHLVVGVNDDASITKCKGPPLMNDAERMAMVSSCKWVDEVVPHVPYIMSDEYLRHVIQKYRIDYVVHGDDPCIVDGRDVYESAQKLGKYRTIPRTEGVSTTEIVGRMLLLSREHHTDSLGGDEPPSGVRTPAAEGEGAVESTGVALNVLLSEHRRGSDAPLPSFVRQSKFMTTSMMLRLFSDGCAPPPEGARVVYVDGGWDMFHAGHVNFLKAAAQLGDFLLVGVHNDAVVNRHRGANFPVMNLNERVLSVLACRWTGDVVIDPPWHLTREMIAALNISVVAHGTRHDRNDDGGRDPYEVPKAMGIFQELPSENPLTVDAIVERIRENHERFTAKVARKMVGEQQYYAARYGFNDASEAAAPVQ